MEIKPISQEEIEWLNELIVVLKKMPPTLIVGSPMNIFHYISKEEPNQFIISLPKV